MPKKTDNPENGEGRRTAKIILPAKKPAVAGPKGLRNLPNQNAGHQQRQGGKPPRFPGRTGGR